MSATPGTMVLTEAQAACLAALKAYKDRKSSIAIHAKLTVSAASSSLRILARRGLASRDQEGLWRATASGAGCRVQTVEGRTWRPRSQLPIDQRLLQILDRPMTAPQILAKLRTSRQLLQLVLIRLHAQGEVTFADPDHPTRLVIPAGMRMSVLSPEEARVLSATPADYAGDLTRIGAVAGAQSAVLPQIIEGLIAQGLAEKCPGPRGIPVYRVTAEGIAHPQRRPGARAASRPRLPVESDRVRSILAAIERSGTIGIKQLAVDLGWQHHATNALIQYLKKKELARKTGPELMAPYTLTEAGSIALAEMQQRWPEGLDRRAPISPAPRTASRRRPGEGTSGDGQPVALTASQAASLAVLRRGRQNKAAVAIHAKLDLTQTEAAMRMLLNQGLAIQDAGGAWHATAKGKACRFDTVADRPGEAESIEASDEHLLTVLNRPMKGGQLAREMHVPYQEIFPQLVRLYARGRLDFADLDRPSWLVMPLGDQTLVLSRDEERVLSAMPADCAWDAAKIRLAGHVAATRMASLLPHLLATGFLASCDGIQGEPVYRLTEAGAAHPQRRQPPKRARARSEGQPPRLAVESERVRNVLATINECGALRIKQIAEALDMPLQATNSLIQYLKGRQMVEKTEPAMNAPYLLTDLGRSALSEVTRRRAA